MIFLNAVPILAIYREMHLIQKKLMNILFQRAVIHSWDVWEIIKIKVDALNLSQKIVPTWSNTSTL